MQIDRRSILKAGGVTAALGATSLAGCSGLLSGGGELESADYRYDPSTVVDTNSEFYGTMDYAALYESRENFPESTRNSFESPEDLPVGPETVDSFTGVGGAQVSVSESPSSTAFGSMALLGSFDQSTVEQALQEDDATQSGEYEGFTLYEGVSSSPGDVGGVEDTSATAAVRDGVLVFGLAGAGADGEGGGVTGEQAARTMIDASTGAVARLDANSQQAQDLNSRLGGTNVMAGGQIDPDLVETVTQQSQGGMQTQFVEGVRAGGVGMTVEGETTTMDAVLLYADAEAAENSGVTQLVDLASQQAVEENPGLDSVEAEYDGNAAVMTVEGETETVFEQGTSTGPGSGLSVVGPAGASAVPGPEL